MWTSLFAAPIFEDEDQTRIASLLNIVLLASLVIVGGYGIIAWFLERKLFVFSIDIAIALISLMLLIILRRGYVHLACWILCSAFWVVITLFTIYTNGVLGPGMGAYFMVVLLSGLLLGARAQIHFAGISILSGLAILSLDLNGALPSSLLADVPLYAWASHSMLLIGTSVFLYLAIRTLDDALTRSRHQVAARKIAEKALREQDRRLRLITDNIQDMVSQINVEGIYQYVSPSHQRILGYAPDEMLGKSTLDYMHPEDIHRVMSEIQTAVQARSASSIQLRFRHADGSYLWLETLSNLLSDENGSPIGAIITGRDITERKHVEEALAASEERYRTLFENAPIGIYRTTPDGRIIAANPSLVRLLDFSSFDELATRNLEQGGYTFDSPRSQFKELVEREGYVTGLEVSWTKSDNSVVTVRENARVVRNPDGSVMYYEGTIEDISERKRAEEALRASEVKNKAIINAIPDMMIRMNKDGVVMDMKPGKGFHMIVLPSDIIGKNAYDTIKSYAGLPEEAIHQIMDSMESTQHNNAPQTFESQVAWGGVQRHFETRLVVSGQDEVLGIIRDVTERKQAEAAVQEQRAYAEALRDTAAALNSTIDFDEVLNRILDNVGRVVPFEAASVMLIEGNTARIVRFRDPSEHLRADWVMGLRVPLDQNPAMRSCAETGEPLIITDSRAYPGLFNISEAAWIQSHLIAAIRSQDQTIGYLTLASTIPNFYTPTHAAHLLAFTNQASVALENARLHDETGQRAEQFALLYDAGMTMNQVLEPHVQLQSLLKQSIQALHADGALFFLCDLTRNELVFEQGIGLGGGDAKTLRDLRIPIGSKHSQDGVSALGDSLFDVTDVLNDPRVTDLYPAALSKLCVPVKHEMKLRGVLGVTSSRANAFSSQDARLLTLFSNQYAVAMENALLFSETQHRIRELQALNRIASAINSSTNLEDVLDLAMQELQEVFGAELCSLMLLDEPSNQLVFKAFLGPGMERTQAMRLNLDKGIAGWVVRTGQSTLVPDVHTDPRWNHDVDDKTGFSTRSILAVPLKNEAKSIGVIEAINKVRGVFNEDDLQLLQSIASVVVTAIEKARMAEQTAQIRVLNEMDRLRSGLVANVSHELRTPLGLIKLFSTTLLSEDVHMDRQTQRQFLADIDQETEKLERIVNNLLDLSRLQSGRLHMDTRPLDLTPMIKDVLRRMEPQFTEHRIVFKEPDCRLVAIIDPQLIEQVLRNLLINAIKYSPKGSTITVSLRERDAQALVQVSDQGIGISSEDIDKVFERFYRVENDTTQRAGGVGLGLAVSRGIIEAHHGQIWVKSTLNVGSTFTFSLPASEEPLSDINR